MDNWAPRGFFPTHFAPSRIVLIDVARPASDTATDRFDVSAPHRAPNGWDKGLLADFRQGQRSALEAVYREFSPEIALLLRQGFAFESRGRRRHFVGYRSAHDLHDALHETFRRAFEPGARDSYDGLRPYAPYLRTIARNLVLGEFRRREALFVDLEEGTPERAEPLHQEAPPSPEEVASRRQTRDLVQAFLATLDADERRLLQLRFVEGLSQRDAAEALRLGRQRIRGRETKLRRKLVRFLNDRGATELMPAGGLAWFLLALEELPQLLEYGALQQRGEEVWA